MFRRYVVQAACRSGCLFDRGQKLARGAGILRNLGRQFVDTGEFSLGPNKGFQPDGKPPPIQVHLLVKEYENDPV